MNMPKVFSVMLVLLFSQCAVAEPKDPSGWSTTSEWVGEYSNVWTHATTRITLFENGNYDAWSSSCSPVRDEEYGIWKEVDGWIILQKMQVVSYPVIRESRFLPQIIDGIHCLVSERIIGKNLDENRILNDALAHTEDKAAVDFKYYWQKGFEFDEEATSR